MNNDNNNKIIVVGENGKSYEMTADQIEAAYRYQAHQHCVKNAQAQLAYNAEWIRDKYGFYYDDFSKYIEKLAKQYEENYTCEMAENDIWKNEIMNIFDET